MNVVQGATGHVWAVAATTLRDRGEDVTVATSDPAKAAGACWPARLTPSW